MPTTNNYSNNGGRSGRGRYRGGRGGGRGGRGDKRQAPTRSEPPPPVETKEAESVTEEENPICVLCAHEVTIYAVGKCDHPVCYRCSMKIRILCEENTCPVCRTELHKVILSPELKSFQQLQSAGRLTREHTKNAGFFFCNDVVGDKFYEILEFRCPKCPDRLPDKTFEETKVHLRKEHHLNYCDICVTHNKQFPYEFKCYNRHDLGIHRRKGDEDDTSHRGHPMCEPCQLRYLDQDVLYQHLRKDHFFCHICDSICDTNQDLRKKMNFYDSYNELNEHYREAHYLCLEGECANVQYTNVFASKIDFQAHVVSKHGGGRTRAQQRMDRTIDIDVHYSNRPTSSSSGFRDRDNRDRDSRSRRGAQGARTRPSRNRDQRNAVGAFEREGEHDLAMARALQASQREYERNSAKETADAVETALTRSMLEDAESFPTLPVTASTSSSSVQPSTNSMPGTSASSVSKERAEKPKEKAAPASTKANRNVGTGLISKWNQATLTSGSLDADFPALSTPSATVSKPFLKPAVTASAITRQDAGKKKAPAASQKMGNNNTSHPPRPDDFPSLPGNYDPKKSLAPQWKKVKGSKMSASAQRIVAHQNSFAALSRSNNGGDKAATSSKSVVGGAKPGNSKKKKKRRDDDDDDDVGGYTTLSRKLISQESFQPKSEPNIKLIEAKPEAAIEKPPQHQREFADSQFDFPTLSDVCSTVAPPPGFGPSAPRYKSPFGGPTASRNGHAGGGMMNPPPGFLRLASTPSPSGTAVVTSSGSSTDDDKEVVQPPPPPPASSDFPPLAPGASAFPGLPTSAPTRNRSRAAPSASRWGGASNGDSQAPSLVESLRKVNIGSGKGKLNLGNVFDYQI